MHLLKMVGVTLGLLPALALVPGVPEVKLTGYEAKLHMQMWSNFEVENEQETSEEITWDSIHPEGAEGISENTSETESQDNTPAPAVETDMESEPPADAVVPAETPLFEVDGYIPDVNLQEYLYNRLTEHGVEWFMPYAVCLIAQESSWNPLAVNPNGRDKGILQYRVEFHSGLDWTNPCTEIDIFVQQMANRAMSGKTVSEMISAHMMSDFGDYNQAYVDAVMSHSGSLVRVR